MALTAKDEETAVSVISRSRLEMLFDGVFAIAMTILVLELKVPELVDVHSVDELRRALLGQAPTFASYLLSFTVLGVFWYRHNHQYRHFRVITPGMLVLYFVQLAAAAFFPFCAALLGRYPVNRLSQVVYVACVLVYTWASFGNLILANRSGSLSDETTPAAHARSQRRLLRGSLIVSVLFVLYLTRILVR